MVSGKVYPGIFPFPFFSSPVRLSSRREPSALRLSFYTYVSTLKERRRADGSLRDDKRIGEKKGEREDSGIGIPRHRDNRKST